MTELMKKMKEEWIDQDSGVILVELLASILLLTIIVTTFLTFFVQAGRTNNRINNMNEATFIVQEQMELITAYAENLNVDGTKTELAKIKDRYIKDGYSITTTFVEKDGLQSVVVIVAKEEKPLAQMETRLSFKK